MDKDKENIEEDAVYLENEEEMSIDGRPETSEPEAGYTPPIVALASRTPLRSEGQVEVSASPAFQCLDDLFQAGKITGTRVSQLKAKYSELHEYRQRTQEHEMALLMEAKDFANELEVQKTELSKADNWPEGVEGEMSKMRQKLLSYRNELAQIEERQDDHEYKIECMMEDKKMMDREYERMPKKGEIEKKLKDLQASHEELKKEIAQKQIEAKNIKEDLVSRRRQILTERKEYEELHEEVERQKMDLVEINQEPGLIAKECERLDRQSNAVMKNEMAMQAEMTALTEQRHFLEARREELEHEKFAQDEELDKQRMLLDEKQKAFDQLARECDLAKEKEAQLMGDRASLDLSLKKVFEDKRSVHDLVTKLQRQKDKDTKNLTKAQRQLRVAKDAIEHTETLLEKKKRERDAAPQDDGTLKTRRLELQKEVNSSNRHLSQKDSLTAVQRVKVEQDIAEEGRLLYEQGDLRIEVVELTRLAAIKADEREQKARDFMRAELKYNHAIEDVKTKDLQIQDHQKKHAEMQIRLKERATLYDVIKNERNKIVNQIQTTTQKSAEMREKLKILANEMEILRTAVSLKEKQLQKTRLRHMNSIVIRDSLRNELAKQSRIDEELKERRKQQKMDIDKLNLMIEHAEADTIDLRRRYEQEVEQRNARGIQLIERNEEVCIFYEKVNIQDTMIRNGNIEMQGLEEQLRFLTMQVKEEQRNINLLRQDVPNKRNVSGELVTLQIQLAQCQERLIELEKALENPDDHDRVRQLGGHDLSPSQLKDKLLQLEERLAAKEEALLEKELVYEQVTRLSDRVKEKAKGGKEDTIQLAKKVNDVQSKIKDITRKMMAMISELSMNQAKALQLQALVKENENELEQQYIRMEKGEPPSDNIEDEWRKAQARHQKLQQERIQRLMDAGDTLILPDGAVSTAEPRPNAYIPDEETELPIPRPYGGHAPFKPQEPGTSMRHIRKPVPKPIEI